MELWRWKRQTSSAKKVKKLAIYEAPYNDDESARQAWQDYRTQLAGVLAEGRNGDAVALFMRVVGTPPEHIQGMRQQPWWPMLEVVAPTLAYDAAAMGEDASVPIATAASIAVPALVMDGGASYPFMKVAAEALAAAMPHAQHLTLEGQTHEVAAEALAPALAEFFNSDPASS